MKVTTAQLGVDYDDYPDAIMIYLDDGTEIGAHCIVDNAEQERASMEAMLNKIIKESLQRVATDIGSMAERPYDNEPEFSAVLHCEAIVRNHIKAIK